MVNMLVYHLSKTPNGENLMIWHITLYSHCLVKKIIWETSKGKTRIKKRVQCIICHNIIHKKPYGKNGWYDIILCQYCLIENFLWETLRENSYKEKSAIWCFNKLLIREMRDSPLKVANLSYRCTQNIIHV
jgi:hypothetical protein